MHDSQKAASGVAAEVFAGGQDRDVCAARGQRPGSRASPQAWQMGNIDQEGRARPSFAEPTIPTFFAANREEYAMNQRRCIGQPTPELAKGPVARAIDAPISLHRIPPNGD